MSLRLHVSTHHAEWSDRRAVLGEKAWDDGMVWSLAWCKLVEMSWRQLEATGSAVEGDAGIGYDDS